MDHTDCHRFVFWTDELSLPLPLVEAYVLTSFRGYVVT
jgi:hypothetical protein